MKNLCLALAFALCACGMAAAQQYDVLIKNGRVVDGSGNPWVYADVGILGDRIAFVGQAGPQVTAKQTIDAKGLIVAPGFIDMLGQSELSLLIDKRAVSKVTQGITTEITGEGQSVAPQNDRNIAEQKDFLEHYHLKMDWTRLGQYFDRLEKQGSGINLGSYVGAAQVRDVELGQADRAPTPAELEDMREMVDDAMEDGALGLSSALIYAPGSYAKTDELISLAKVAAEDGGIYASHIRNEADHGSEALDEAFRIGREANIPVEIFHFKVAGKENWGKMPQRIAAVEQARAEGIDVTADQYPYTAAATGLSAVIPPKYHEGGSDALIARLKDAAARAAIRAAIEEWPDRWIENFWNEAGGADGVRVVSVLDPALKRFEGQTMAQIAAAEHKDPLDAMMDLVIADHDNTTAVFFVMDEPEVQLAMQQPWVSVCLDYSESAPDGPLSDSKNHPRAYGSFTRILGEYVRGRHALRLEDAIRKFTSLPAQRVRLRERGMVRPDYFADLTIFDPATVAARATYDQPNLLSAGIEYVFVNGVLEMAHGQMTGALGGRPLRGNGYYAHNYNPEGQPMRGEVRGVITGEDGYPVGRTRVTLLAHDGTKVGEFTTHYDGKYAIPYQQSCMGCTVHAERMGFASARHKVDFNGADSLWFSFALKRLPPHIRAAKTK